MPHGASLTRVVSRQAMPQEQTGTLVRGPGSSASSPEPPRTRTLLQDSSPSPTLVAISISGCWAPWLTPQTCLPQFPDAASFLELLLKSWRPHTVRRVRAALPGKQRSVGDHPPKGRAGHVGSALTLPLGRSPRLHGRCVVTGTVAMSMATTRALWGHLGCSVPCGSGGSEG